MTQPTPVYLFVTLVPIERINDIMHCVRYPLPGKPFYWLLNPERKDAIPLKDRSKYNIPELESGSLVGSHWFRSYYNGVRTHSRTKHYHSNGKRYARDHGYVELIQGEFLQSHTRASLISIQGDPHNSSKSSHGGACESLNLYHIHKLTFLLSWRCRPRVKAEPQRDFPKTDSTFLRYNITIIYL